MEPKGRAKEKLPDGSDWEMPVGSSSEQVLVERYKELRDRFGLKRPEQIASILKLSRDLAAQIISLAD